MLKVFVDFTCPGSYLAREPTLEFIDSHQIETTWHLFQNWDRDLPQAGADADTVLSHEHARQASIRRTHEHYAALRGLDLRLNESKPDAALALGVLAQLCGGCRSFVDAAFDAYWQEGVDINDVACVERLLSNANASNPSLDFGDSLNALSQAQDAAEEMGVVAAPAYLLNGELFVGRQHFPLLERRIAQIGTPT